MAEGGRAWGARSQLRESEAMAREEAVMGMAAWMVVLAWVATVMEKTALHSMWWAGS